MKEVPPSAAFTGHISLSLALWIIELAPVEKILFADILSLPARECQANKQNPHGRVPLPGSCRSNWSKFLNFLIMALLQHEPEESIASPAMGEGAPGESLVLLSQMPVSARNLGSFSLAVIF